MRAIQQLLFGIGILLFCMCLYTVGADDHIYAGIAYYLQFVGLLFLIIGAVQKPKDDENHN